MSNPKEELKQSQDISDTKQIFDSMFHVSDEIVIEMLKQCQCEKESQESEWLCPICLMLVYDPMVCQNCEPLYCRSCLNNLKNNECPTCK